MIILVYSHKPERTPSGIVSSNLNSTCDFKISLQGNILTDMGG